MSLAVSVIFYATLFIALGALEPAAGFFPERKLSAPVSLRLVAAAEKAGSSAASRTKDGNSGDRAQKRQNRPPESGIAPEPEAMPVPSNSFGAPDAVDVAAGDGNQTGAGALAGDGFSFGDHADNPEGNQADNSASTGAKQGSSTIGGVSAGCSPGFVSWLDSAIRTKLFYPEKARKRNLEGTVTILTEVTADGTQCEASVAQSSGSSILDRAAVSFVKSLFPAPVPPQKAFSGTLRIRYILTQEGT